MINRTSIKVIAPFFLLFWIQCSHAQLNLPNLEKHTLELAGETDCEYGSRDCNPCVTGLLEQIKNLSTEQGESNVYRFPNGEMGIQMNLFNHPQSIARIPGVDNENWMLISRNYPRDEKMAGVVSIKFSDIKSNGGAWPDNETLDSEGKMNHFYSTHDNTHPGGGQLIGQRLVVAHEGVAKGIEEPTWISFYDVTQPNSINECNRFCFNGIDANGTPYFMTKKGQAMCVGMSRLSNGHYLMFALESRRRLSNDVGWFFESTSTDLSSADWKFLQSWQQTDLLPNKKDFRTFENINIVTDCSDGQLYMLGFYGKGKSNVIDVFSIKRNTVGKIVLEKVLEKKVTTRSGGATFRAGATVHVTPQNELLLYSVQKSGNRKWVTIEEFKQREPAPSYSTYKAISSGN